MARPSKLHTSGVWITTIAVAVSMPLATSTCTNHFAELYAVQQADGGGEAGAPPAACWDGTAAEGTPAPPSSAFLAPCMATDGCRSTTEQPSSLACNVCGAACDGFTCAGEGCEIWCSQGTTCHDEHCAAQGMFTFYCDGCDGQASGSATDTLVKCTAGAVCDISFDASAQTSFKFECSNSKCKFLSQAANIRGTCEQNSTCDIDCKSQKCGFAISCDKTSTCIIRCDTKDASLCPAPECGDAPPFDCGAAGWRCNATSCS